MSGLAILLFRQYFRGIPDALIDAARIDGCSEFAILFRIIWPLSRPAILTVAILTFMASWNDVLWPLIVVRERSLMTMPQLVTIFVTGGEAESQLGSLLAAATLLALPVVVAYAFFQRYFIESMASTGIKG
jgi:ABC-type glycerol-3-phosphate transport system permease component